MRLPKILLWATPLILLCGLFFATCVDTCDTTPDPADRAAYQLPADLPDPSTETTAAEFAWQTFIAMNWPAAAGTTDPDPGQPFGAPGTTVWETWMEVFDLFDNPAEPPAWGAPNLIPGQCGTSDATKALHHTSKVSDLLDERDQAVGGAIVDPRGNIARYEVRVNRPMFDFIVDNGLNTREGQGTFPEDKFTFPNGSIELKGAWKKLVDGKDDFARYHRTKAIIYDEGRRPVNTDCLPEGVRDSIEKCEVATMGLVGLHVVYRVPSAPSSVWMTFEQVDNTDDAPAGIDPSFYDPNCPECPPNTRFCDDPSQAFTQIKRVVLGDEATTRSNEIFREVNEQMHASDLVKGTVWENYKLVGVQYPTDPDFDRVGKPNRRILANTTMETFNQSASSCVGCHAFARSTNPAFLSDFSWFMGRAKSDPNFKLGPESTAEEIMYYVSYINPYKLWGTWPDDQWNQFSAPMGGENPHGKQVRIFVNDVAYSHVYDADGNMRPDHGQVLPVGSIILKENYRVPFPVPPTPSDLVEITVMYKQKGQAGPTDDPQNWNWIKSTPNGTRIDNRGSDESCFSCHSWQGNGDFMLTYNFGEEPVIQTNRIDRLLKEDFAVEHQLTPEEVELLQRFTRDKMEVQALMQKVAGGGK